ncbi:MAG: proline dehydrogenase family protein [Thermoguttaceae bacterium]
MAVSIAEDLLQRAQALQTPRERRVQAQLDRMIRNPRDKAALVQITDQAFRSGSARRVADQLTHLLAVHGVPRFFSLLDRTLLHAFQTLGNYLPAVAVPPAREKLRRQTARVVLPAEPRALAAHLEALRTEGVRVNVNFLGEAILGENEAHRRIDAYLEALQMPEIEVVSVKISTICSQISPLAWRDTVAVLSDRLERLYRAASAARFTRADGTAVPKFVYLDMEEYRDMELTARAFMATLDRPGLENVGAGIALQSYLPDAYAMQLRLNHWARARLARDGAPITLRIVKGANMEMERVEASLRGWPQAPYKTKRETDANFKRMIHEALRPENLAAVRLGVASHNLFDLAYGLQLAVENDGLDRVQFEMLQGMADHQRRALLERTRNLLLYAPACHRRDFIHAIGYLVRRLDENTGPDNFLAHASRLRAGSGPWQRLQKQFFDSFDAIASLSQAPRRNQNRNLPPQPHPPAPGGWQTFQGEPDTDFSLPHNVAWTVDLVERWQTRSGPNALEIPLVVAGQEVVGERPLRECLDPSRPGVVVGRYRQAVDQDVDRAVACARTDRDHWRDTSAHDRAEVLRQVAHEIRRARADLVGAALANGGKTVMESDPEVSEAVDFVEFYAQSAAFYDRLDAVRSLGLGVVVVVSPWNFPIAIPCGGVAAALAAGNTVILKPASDTVLVAHLLCDCFWRAGISRQTLQLLPCTGPTAGQHLVAHDRVDAVVLTGGTETARQMLRSKPGMNLIAETGGKNATIVTAMSDRDQAIKHVLHSAFSHGGQKCSATSLLVLEDEVYHDGAFKAALCDAVTSIKVGPAWQLETKMGPLIRPPSGALQRGLTQLEEGESWAVRPRQDDRNPCLVTPGVKWGVRPGSFTHMTELFGPVLGVMRAGSLHEAVAIVNSTGYGLTSGLESLDDREQAFWVDSIRAGNLYVNRPTTGAIVLRQPFGGMGKSVFGPGIKAGGPNYVAQLMRFQPDGTPRGGPVDDPHLAELEVRLTHLPAAVWDRGELDRIAAALRSYGLAMSEEFSRRHDHFRLVGQDNFRRYLPVPRVRVRLHPADTLFDLFARVSAAKTAGCMVTVSSPPGPRSPGANLLEELTRSWTTTIDFADETDDQVAALARQDWPGRLRYAAPDRVPGQVRLAAAEAGHYVAANPVLAVGRIELLWYFREQSLSVDYHRYGNLGPRSGESRAEPL